MREPSDAYLAPASSAQAELREKGSRFRAFLIPVSSEAEADAARAELAANHADASHHCWAQRIGFPPVERSSDAGEPAGTAGIPILRVLQGVELCDALVVVVRWFGGTKLGKGGLARAYSGVTQALLRAARTSRKVPTVLLELEVDWNQMGAIERLLRPPEVELSSVDYGDRIHLWLQVHREAEDRVRDALRSAGIAT